MNKCFQIALGGLATAVCILFMFMTGFVPFGEFILPTAAGIVLIACVCEMGLKPAFLVYIASALLSLVVCPVKESAMLYTMLLGYYPLLWPLLQKVKPAPLRLVAKFLLFNGAVLLCYFLLMKLFGLVLLENGGMLTRYVLYAAAALMNLFFILYDKCVRLAYFFYMHIFRKKYLRRT